ncbi:MAG: hypothetical protein AAFP17_13570 [Pseudomonadota bacterium]
MKMMISVAAAAALLTMSTLSATADESAVDAAFDQCQTLTKAQHRNSCFRQAMAQDRVKQAHEAGEDVVIHVDANAEDDSDTVAAAKAAFDAALVECGTGKPVGRLNCRRDAYRAYQAAIGS